MLPAFASLASVIHSGPHQHAEHEPTRTDSGNRILPAPVTTNGANNIAVVTSAKDQRSQAARRRRTASGHQINGEGIKSKKKNRRKITSLFYKRSNSDSSSSIDSQSEESSFLIKNSKDQQAASPWPVRRYQDDIEDYFTKSIPAVYLPARPRKSNRSTELIRRATLAEPEPSISDCSQPGTAPPSPPIPPIGFLTVSANFTRGDSFASARDTSIPEANLDCVSQNITAQPFEFLASPETITEATQTGSAPLISGQWSFETRNIQSQLTLHSLPSSGDHVISNISPTTAGMDPLKRAFYNVSAFTMAICSVFGAIAAYFLFYEFVKPAMWALICGIVLFPLKRHLSGVVKRWLDQLSETGRPLTLAMAALPFDVTNQLGELLLDTTTNNLKLVVLMVAAFPASALILHFGTIPRSLVTAKQFLLFIDRLVAFFQGFWVPILLITYLSYICFSNLFHGWRSKYLCHLCISWTIWCAGVAYGCNYFGPLRTPIFLALLAICSTYYFPFFNTVLSTKNAINRLRNKSTKRENRSRKETSSSEHTAQDSSAAVEKGPNREDEDGDNESNTYLKRLFIACFFVYVSLHLWIMFALILPIGIALARRIAVKFDIRSLIERNWQAFKTKLDGDTALLFPAPFLHVFRVLLHIDRQVIYYLRQSMDLVGSMTAMVMLLVSVAALIGFVMFQLYYESMHLINLTADIANQTLTKNPGLQKWLRNTVHVESVADLANEAVQRAYGISRNWLSAQMQEIVQDDPEKAKLLESQVVNTLDAFFHNWLISRNSTNSTALAHSAGHRTAFAQWADVWTAIGESGGDLEWNFFENLHEYISVLLSVADSAWMIVKNNLEILMVGFSQIASTLFASGTAVVDFFLDSIVFLTFLMYLLTESDEEYKPLKLIRDLVPGGQNMACKITEQVEQAVNGVFLATSKMAIFYGMLTWLTHTLFAVNLVFIPSVLAAAFAAIPFFGTYLVALPAVLELWLIRGEPFLAILLFVIHYIPSHVVDDAIYSDIRLTTPLLSGMAIAGGMLWWGLEGAIFGPLVLCGILVLGGVYKTIFFKTMTSTGSIPSNEGSSNGPVETSPVALQSNGI